MSRQLPPTGPGTVVVLEPLAAFCLPLSHDLRHPGAHKRVGIGVLVTGQGGQVEVLFRGPPHLVRGTIRPVLPHGLDEQVTGVLGRLAAFLGEHVEMCGLRISERFSLRYRWFSTLPRVMGT
ncbi:hypothetical protein [Corynebacterium sp. CCUG 71335]|uniref:hypothetical protein n=1 Tax=Corynebacterium sp. CCUG 71335 TaxID=2823892 RepID=UPI002108AD00|nr:hypothetical protein [Corynebacterium sp. CCUG 71335]